MSRIPLNAPCPCGSGKKYKRCCGADRRSTTELAAKPHEDWRGLVNAAVALQQNGDPAAAARLYDQVLRVQPGLASVQGLRGMAALQLGEVEIARTFIESAVASDPRDSRLRNFLGQVLADQGELIEAERSFGYAVSLAPDFVEAWANLGIVQTQNYRPKEAIISLTQAMRLVPDDVSVLLHLAKAYYLTRDMTAAERILRKTRDLGEYPGRVNLLLCVVLRTLGQADEAEILETEALVKYSPNGEAYDLLLELGHDELEVGRASESEYWLRKALEICPDQPQPYIELVQARKFSESDRPWIDKIEHMAESATYHDKRRLEFALGKIYTDLGDYERSFSHYKRANDLVRAHVPDDANAYARYVDCQIERFSSERLCQMPAGSDSKVPICIVGTPRSGTTLTEQIVASHSQIAGAGELSYWDRIALTIKPGFPENYTVSMAKTLAEGYLGYLRLYSASASGITDKMPHNYENVGLIHGVLPNAKIIHCRRHPIDACLSIYFQDFADSHTYRWDLESLADWYEQYQRIMAHWRSVLPPGVMYEIEYERLVEDTIGESKKLMEFLGFDWEPAQLDFYKQDRAVFTSSKWQARQPIYKSSKERWRRYEKHVGPLKRLLKYAQ
jgi:Tfp pilus assembly protein PilF